MVLEVLTLHPDKCTGCRVCEIACSYHFDKLFNRKSYSIEVARNEKEGIFLPVVHTIQTSKRKACDLCKGEQKPLCIKYCTVGAIELIGSQHEK